jgi:TfoX/Sxy family transcriptional regulator of competence genes
MAYDEKLADRIREALVEHGITEVEEKRMFSGICFMVDGKMCVCATKDGLLSRIGPEYKDALELNGIHGMIRNGKPLKDYVYVGPDAMKTKQQLENWINKALAFNKFAKASKK